MSTSTKGLIIPILIITVGVGWLLTVQGIGPQINWVWTLGLGVIGVLTFAAFGFDKLTMVIGPFLLVGSLLSILRQMGRLSLDTEVPVLVILMGVLSLVVQSNMIPFPKWYSPKEEPSPDKPSN